MADTDLLFSIIAKDEYQAQMEAARAAVDKLTDAEKQSLVVSEQHQSVEEKLAGAMDLSNEAKQRAADQLAKLDEQYKSGAISLTAYNKGVEEVKTSIDKASESSLNWAETLTGLNQGAELVKTGLTGVAETLQKAWDFTKEGAAIERIQTQFRNSANEMGMDGENLMKRMQAAVHGTVDDEELAMTATKALTMGVVDSGDQMVKALELARAVSIRFGTDTQSSFQSIIQSADMLSERGFKRMGIILPPLKSLVDDYAKAHGMAAGQVDTETQKTILLNAALEKGQDIINKVGTQGEDTTTKMQRFEATVADVGDTIKVAFVDTIGGPAIDALDVMVTGNQRLADAFVGTAAKMKQSVLDGGMSIDQYNTALRSMANNMIQGVGPAMADELFRTNQLNFAQVEGARVGGIFAETQKKIGEAAKAAAAESAAAEQDRVKAITDEEAAMKRANDAYRDQIVVQSEARSLAISYTQDEQKLADLQGKLATLDAQIAAQGPVHTAQVNNQKMSEEQRALTLQKLAVAQENITQIQRKAGETDAEYNLRLTEAKGKVDSLSQSLGTHTVALGGATKAQDEQRKSLEGQIAALQKATETQKATDVFNALTKAFQDGKIGADEFTARAEALNSVTHLYTDTALKAATQQELLINSFVDPNSANWRGQLLLNEKAINGVADAATEADKPVKELISNSQKPVSLKVDADTSDARKKMQEVRETQTAFRDDPIQIKATADTNQALNEILKLHEKATSEQNKVVVRADLDPTAAQDKLTSIQVNARKQAVTFNVNADTTEAENALKNLFGEKFKAPPKAILDVDIAPGTKRADDYFTALSNRAKTSVTTPMDVDIDAATEKLDDYYSGPINTVSQPVTTKFDANTDAATGKANTLKTTINGVPTDHQTVFEVIANEAMNTIQDLLKLQAEFKNKTVTWTVNEVTNSSGGGNIGGNIPGAQAGANYIVPPNPRGGMGDYFPILAAPGERVQITTPGQQASSGGAGNQTNIISNDTYNLYDTLITRQVAEQRRIDNLKSLVGVM